MEAMHVPSSFGSRGYEARNFGRSLYKEGTTQFQVVSRNSHEAANVTEHCEKSFEEYWSDSKHCRGCRFLRACNLQPRVDSFPRLGYDAEAGPGALFTKLCRKHIHKRRSVSDQPHPQHDYRQLQNASQILFVRRTIRDSLRSVT